MSILVCGSLAFDTIASFDGRFSDQILPDKVHILNVSFVVPTLRREWGGCAGNIAYSLSLLGARPVVLAAIGSDGDEYVARLAQLGVDTSLIHRAADAYTAQCHITTDADNNQITAFHPGAMDHAARATLPPGRDDIRIGIVGPDHFDAMLGHAAAMQARGIPFVFDPGQQLPRFDASSLDAMLGRARWVAVNDYEAAMLAARAGGSIETLSQRPGLDGIVVTLGDAGADVWQHGRCTRVAGRAAARVVDPTGCGDAFRAAMLHGLDRGWPLARAAALGNVLGALKIAERGGQNHRLPEGFDPDTAVG